MIDKSINDRFTETLNYIISEGFAKIVAEIAKKCEINQGKFTDIKKYRYEPSREILKSVSDHYPVNKVYIETGEGKKLLTGEGEVTITEKDLSPSPTLLSLIESNSILAKGVSEAIATSRVLADSNSEAMQMLKTSIGVTQQKLMQDMLQRLLGLQELVLKMADGQKYKSRQEAALELSITDGRAGQVQKEGIQMQTSS